MRTICDGPGNTMGPRTRRECTTCGEDKPETEFVGGEDRCRRCAKKQQAGGFHTNLGRDGLQASRVRYEEFARLQRFTPADRAAIREAARHYGLMRHTPTVCDVIDAYLGGDGPETWARHDRLVHAVMLYAKEQAGEGAAVA